jgi:lipopolysaccharide export system permease protein
MSLLSAIGAVAGVRLIGFACTVIGVHFAPALAVQYVVLAAVSAYGLYAISRGVIIEPPALITNLLSTIGERIAKRTGALAAAK